MPSRKKERARPSAAIYAKSLERKISRGPSFMSRRSWTRFGLGLPAGTPKRSDHMWTFGKKIAAGFAVSFALLAAIGVVSYRAADSLTKTSYLVAHTHLVLENVSNILSQLK